MKCRNLYVGNLKHSVTSDDLQELFADYGGFEKVYIIKRKSFGFVEMYIRSENNRARKALNGAELQERTFFTN